MANFLDKPRPTPMMVLKSVLDAVPKSSCAGFCAMSCGTQSFTPLEWKMIPERLRRGKKRPDFLESLKSMFRREIEYFISGETKEPNCQFLTEGGNCSIYEYRPFVCRVWGQANAKNMTCRFGCESLMSEDEFLKLFQRWQYAHQLSGDLPQLSRDYDTLEKYQRQHKAQIDRMICTKLNFGLDENGSEICLVRLWTDGRDERDGGEPDVCYIVTKRSEDGH